MKDKTQYIWTIVSEQGIGTNGWDKITKKTKMNVYLIEHNFYWAQFLQR